MSSVQNMTGNDSSLVSGANASSSLPSSSGVSMENNPYFRWAKVSAASLITIVIIASNTINLLVLYRMREIGRRMKILLMSLCTSDLCLGLFVCMPGVVSGVLSHWPFGPVMCQITGTMNGVAISVSLWSLMAIGVERYLVMKNSGVSKRTKHSPVVCLCVAFIWTFNTLFFALPIAWEPGYMYYNYDPDVLTCSFTWKHTWHFMAAKFLYPILSGTVIVFTSWQVNQILKQAERARKQWIISPGSKVTVKGKGRENSSPKATIDTKHGQTKKCSASRPSPNCPQMDPFPDMARIRLSASQNPLLTREFQEVSSVPPLTNSQFSCSNIYGNNGACLVNGIYKAFTDVNHKAYKGSATAATDKCFQPDCLDTRAMSSPLSESDLMVHLRNSIDISKNSFADHKSPAANSGNHVLKSQSENTQDVRNFYQQRNVSPPANQIDPLARSSQTKQNNISAKLSFLPLSIKKKWEKKMRAPDSLDVQGKWTDADTDSENQLSVPMSKAFLRRQRKAKALLLCSTTVFFIAISPYSISSLLEHFIPHLALPPWLRFLALWTLCTNCLMNVFIYSAVYTEFKNRCKHLFRAATCRVNKVKDNIVSRQTSSVYELFAVKSKADNSLVTKSVEDENSDKGANIKAQEEVCTNKVTASNKSSSTVKLPGKCQVLSPSTREPNLQYGPRKTHYLELPPLVQSNKGAWPRHHSVDMPNVLQILPAHYYQRKLQPRDDLGIGDVPNQVPLKMKDAPNPATSLSFGISPSISRSTTCSLDSFYVEMMPSVDV